MLGYVRSRKGVCREYAQRKKVTQPFISHLKPAKLVYDRECWKNGTVLARRDDST